MFFKINLTSAIQVTEFYGGVNVEYLSRVEKMFPFVFEKGASPLFAPRPQPSCKRFRFCLQLLKNSEITRLSL